jgi:hypothetical protein
VIALATELSKRSLLIVISRQRPPAPTVPAASLNAEQASDATWVPWPISSVRALPGRSPEAEISIARETTGRSCGCETSKPVSITATVAFDPLTSDQASGSRI